MTGRRIYSPELVEWVRQHAGECSVREMEDRIRERFGMEITYDRLKCFYANHKIHAAKYHPPKGQRVFSPEVAKFIEENYKGTGPTKMSEIIREKFGILYPPDKMKGYYARSHYNSGVSGRFEKGQPSHNKGKKASEETKARIRASGTMFEAGHRPHNQKPVGSEVKIDGYWKVKIAEPDKWMLKSRYIWEKVHGEKLTPDDAVLFLDKNPDNFDPDNLVKVSRAELGQINRDDLRGEDPEINITAVNLARLKVKAKSRKREKHGKNNRD